VATHTAPTGAEFGRKPPGGGFYASPPRPLRHYYNLEYSAYMTLDAELRRGAIEYADRLRIFGYPTLQNNRWTLGPNIP
jgi:hypothetical protein